MPTRQYYAFEYRYGAKTLWQGANGRLSHAGTLHAFPTRSARDAWVEARPTDYRGNRGYRDAVTRAWAIRNGDIARPGAAIKR